MGLGSGVSGGLAAVAALQTPDSLPLLWIMTGIPRCLMQEQHANPLVALDAPKKSIIVY